MALSRGSMVTVATQGDFGKPRPAVIVQSTRLMQAAPETAVICPLTTEMGRHPALRIRVEPSPTNGLQQPSEIMADKILTVHRSKIGKVIGRLEAETLEDLNRSLAFVIGLAD